MVLKGSFGSRALALAMACFGGLATASCAQNVAIPSERIYIIGQDLDALRGYLASDCCPTPDGGTAYLGFFALLDPAANFGGLGLDPELTPIASEEGWGAGPVSAWKTAQEAGGEYLAIGLDLTGEPEHGAFARIAEGAFDAEIDQLGRFIRATDKTVLLRVGYEFDGVWNAPYADRAAYRAMWRHVVERLRAQDDLKVQFVWQGSASPIDDVIEQTREDIAEWYPGDDYVDWVGTSWFLGMEEVPAAARQHGEFVPPTQLAMTRELLDFARERGKPVMVAELSPQGYDLAAMTRRNIGAVWDGPSGENEQAVSADQIWQDWYAPFFDLLEQDDTIRAIAYINVDWDSQAMWGPPYSSGYWGDTRLQENPVIAARWSESIERWRDARGLGQE